MSSRARIGRQSSTIRGVALLIVLAFIVLLSILLVAFVSFTRLDRMSSVSYSTSIQAQEIAQGGLQDILGDLHQQIVAGSTALNGGSSSYPPLYVPTTNWTASPARLGYNLSYYGTNVTSSTLPPTLLWVSRASQDATPTDFYPNQAIANTTYYPGTIPANYASAANSSSNSINAHYIPASRWNKIALLSTNATIPPAFATNTPDWVFVTRTGRSICTTSQLTSSTGNILPSNTLTNSSSVVGRYAFAVYDEGALLDINVAGYLSGSTNIPTTLGGKSYLAYADLSQLPGLTSAGAQTVIDNLVQWRNASASISGTPSTAANGTNYLTAVPEYATNGYLSFNSSDAPVLGRQDLINYFAKVDPNGNSYSEALPYLGTFSRAVTAPSWRPMVDASTLGGNNGSGKTYAYADNADTGTITTSVNTTYIASGTSIPNPNRDIPNVRFTTAATITHYNDDGTTSTYTVSAGSSVAQRRFSLAKLVWLGHNGPDSTKFASSVSTAQQAAAVYACFGVVWDSTNLCWDYDHTHGQSSAISRGINNILTLGEIGAGKASLDGTTISAREPDFFELLKAGILNGSVGQQPGPVAASGTTTATGPAGISFDYYSAETDRHVRQIGVNIIDQTTANNYPSAVYQNLDISVIPPYGEDDLFNTVYGEKNLPVLQRINTVSYLAGVAVPTGTATAAGEEDVWIQPELWNPHISSTGLTANVPNTPTSLRIVTFGGCAISSTENNAASTASRTNLPVYANFGTSLLSPQTAGIIGFLNPQITSAKPTGPPDPFFDEPQTLIGYGAQANYQDTSQTSGPKNDFTYDNPPPGNTRSELLGVWLGQLPRDPVTYNGPHTINVTPLSSQGEPQLTFVVEYYDGSSWRPYSVMSRVQEVNSLPYSDSELQGEVPAFIAFTAASPDPRTDRFSASWGHLQNAGQNFDFEWAMNQTIRPSNLTTSTQGSGSGSTANRGGLTALLPSTTAGFTYNDFGTHLWNAYLLDDWEVNQASASVNSYQDPDGLTRPGDSWRADYEPSSVYVGTGVKASPWFSTGGDGVMTYQYESVTYDNATTYFNPSNAVISARGRPVIMDHPFKSVGELGYVFRDLPFKTLDFWSTQSADSALLDLFSVSDEPPFVAGEIDPNFTPQLSMQAILNGTMKQQNASVVLGTNNPASSTLPVSTGNLEAASISQAVANELSVNGPLNNRADLVRRLSAPVYTTYTFVAGSDNPQCNKSYGENYIRGLAPVSNTRTWNLLIDIIAQSGHMTTASQSLNDFYVEGEKRYWLHIAIDRYTGKIVDQQLEPVYE